MADVVEITDREQLQHYRMVWNSLLAQTPRASFFHTYDWLAQFWKHCGRDRRFRILVIRACGEPMGIVPLCIQRENYHVGALRVLTFPLSDWGTWYGPIGQNQSACMFMAMQHLRNTRRDWDVAELRWVDSGPGDRSGTDRAMRVAGMTPRKSVYQNASVIRMHPSWEDYLASRTSKFRHEVRRQFRTVESIGDVEFIRHRPASAADGDGDPRWDLFDDCQQVAGKSWQGSSATGNTICHEQVRGFLRDCHAEAARLGMLDVGLLRVNGRPAAFAYNYHFDGAVIGLRIGYDAEVSKRGLGRALLAHVLRDSHQRGDREYDLGVGDYDFKRRFRTHVETSYQHSYFPSLAWKPQSLRLSRWLKQRLHRSVDSAPKSQALAN